MSKKEAWSGTARSPLCCSLAKSNGTALNGYNNKHGEFSKHPAVG